LAALPSGHKGKIDLLFLFPDHEHEIRMQMAWKAKLSKVADPTANVDGGPEAGGRHMGRALLTSFGFDRQKEIEI
jgi:hypothetical protein